VQADALLPNDDRPDIGRAAASITGSPDTDQEFDAFALQDLGKWQRDFMDILPCKDSDRQE